MGRQLLAVLLKHLGLVTTVAEMIVVEIDRPGEQSRLVPALEESLSLIMIMIMMMMMMMMIKASFELEIDGTYIVKFFLLKILINNCFFNLHLRVDKPYNTAMLQDILKVGDIDFVNSVCPCAGLSTLNTSVKVNALLHVMSFHHAWCVQGPSGRGSGAQQNEWMVRSAEFVLRNIRPKVREY